MTETTPVRAAAEATIYGSDVLADLLRKLDIPYVALNPGSSFRGLHDSLVNLLGNRDPEMLLCLHEEHAVAIAHGWAKVTGKPLAVILHANVGLMHASMAIYNAWCDRVPMLVLGATGPVDAAKRRPWIDWLHSSRDQAAIVRPYMKWDDQPASLAASIKSTLRAMTLTTTDPKAPVYVCYDVSVQEEALEGPTPLPDPAHFRAPQLPPPGPADMDVLIAKLQGAQRPVFLYGRVSRSEEDWNRRVALAEHFNARVLTDIKTAAAFPTRHPLHRGAPGYFLDGEACETLRDTDLIVFFDWVDPAGALTQAGIGTRVEGVVNVSCDGLLANGWSLDHQDALGCELSLIAMPDTVVSGLCDRAGAVAPARLTPVARPTPTLRDDAALSVEALAELLHQALSGTDHSLLRVTLSWNGAQCDFRGPLDYLGYDGGAGIGSGPGMAVGAALALKGSGRLPVAVLGDGDFLMGATALWTGVAHEVPLLIVVANNRSYFNDEVHQERVARTRGRPVENKHIGQEISGPDIDIAAMARAQGALAFDAVETVGAARPALDQALDAVREGRTVVLEARVLKGYSEAMSAGMTEDSAAKD